MGEVGWGKGLSAWRAFLEAHAAVLELLHRELEAERGLPLTWYDVLLHLAEAPDHRLRMGELAGRLVITRGGVTRLVARMEAAGLVARTVCETDGRGTYAVLRPRGHRALREAAPVHLRGIREHFLRHVSAREVHVLGAALGRVRDAARADREPPRTTATRTS
jgi:DNA-binding MarR family transcriptional regulator